MYLILTESSQRQVLQEEGKVVGSVDIQLSTSFLSPSPQTLVSRIYLPDSFLIFPFTGIGLSAVVTHPLYHDKYRYVRRTQNVEPSKPRWFGRSAGV